MVTKPKKSSSSLSYPVATRLNCLSLLKSRSIAIAFLVEGPAIGAFEPAIAPHLGGMTGASRADEDAAGSAMYPKGVNTLSSTRTKARGHRRPALDVMLTEPLPHDRGMASIQIQAIGIEVFEAPRQGIQTKGGRRQVR